MTTAFTVALLMLSCRGPRCEDISQCGDQQACVRGRCEDVACLSSSQCTLNHYCNLETYTCFLGCEYPEDCFAGETCDPLVGECQTRTCADTQTDCDVGERCSQATGECSLDPLPHCMPCTNNTQCGAGGSCVGWEGGYYCFFACNPEQFDPCPSGYQCGSPSNLCVANCRLLDDQQ